MPLLYLSVNLSILLGLLLLHSAALQHFPVWSILHDSLPFPEITKPVDT